ncbi:MAG: DNA polymerase III subunit gamma/tau [Candidatus Marinimicrobia bacterium]|nr:DNA polymerase III subunit gamma/tau [Candidatus Neomarinimicrobiota bacterium]
MSHQVISLKYRPQRFEDVIGQEHITITLKNAIEKNRLGHAYIFSGPRGTGKTTTARLLAKVVNCENPQDGNPCNECTSCREITEGRSLDVLEIDGASNRGIDSIRDLREQVKYPPTRGKYKVYIIDEFHQITKDAFNALLKTLEEPPKHILFIFATTELHKVLPTILSRCQRFEFKRIPLLQVMDLLKNIAKQEGISIDDDSLLLIAKKGDGSIRDSESILEQVIAFSDKDISYESILNILGVIREEVYFEMFQALMNSQAEKAIDIIDNMLMHGYDLAEFVSMFSIFLRDLYMVKAHGSADILNTTENLKKNYTDLAKTQDAHTLIRMLAIVNDEMPKLSRSSNTKILVETLFIKLSNLQDLRELDEVIGQIQRSFPQPAVSQNEQTTAPKVTQASKSRPENTSPKSTSSQSSYKSPILNGNYGNGKPSTDNSQSSEHSQEKTTGSEPDQPTQDGGHAISFEDIRSNWEKVIECIQPKKPAVASLLCNVGISSLRNGTLILAVEDEYSFNTIGRNEKIICSCLEIVFKEKLLIKIDKKEVAESQRVIKKQKIDEAAKKVIQSFEGELL